MLPWSKDRDKLTVGSMAKFTLASNAAHDSELLAMLKREVSRQPPDVQPILKEVIEASETVELAQMRKARSPPLTISSAKGRATSATYPPGARSVKESWRRVASTGGSRGRRKRTK
jgi:hypothetical protein